MTKDASAAKDQKRREVFKLLNNGKRDPERLKADILRLPEQALDDVIRRHSYRGPVW